MKKVLLVDDEPDIRHVLARRLRSEGYQVIEAQGGKEAIEKAKKELPNLILLDIVMPDIDGGEVAQILKEDKKTKDIPIIFLTCLFTKSDEQKEGHMVGEYVFIAKPYETHELLNIIHDSIK